MWLVFEFVERQMKQKNNTRAKLANPIQPASLAKADIIFPIKSFDFKLNGRSKTTNVNQNSAFFTSSNRLSTTSISGKLNKKCSVSVTKKFGVNARNNADHSRKLSAFSFFNCLVIKNKTTNSIKPIIEGIQAD